METTLCYAYSHAGVGNDYNNFDSVPLTVAPEFGGMLSAFQDLAQGGAAEASGRGTSRPGPPRWPSDTPSAQPLSAWGPPSTEVLL